MMRHIGHLSIYLGRVRLVSRFTNTVFQGTDELKAETRAATAWASYHILILASRSSFVTHELWTAWRGCRTEARLPPDRKRPAQTRRCCRGRGSAEIDWVVDLVSAIRSVRSEMNVPRVQTSCRIERCVGADKVAPYHPCNLIAANARLQRSSERGTVSNAAQVVVGEAVVLLPLPASSTSVRNGNV